MNNLIRSELYKIRKSKVIILGVLFTVLMSVYWMAQWDKDSHIMSEQFLNVKYSIGYSFNYVLGEALIFLFIAGKFIVEDFKNKTLNHSVLTYRYSRSKVLLSKLIVFILLCLFLETIYSVLFNSYVAINYGVYEINNIDSILYLFRVILLGVIYSISLMCIIFCVAVLSRNVLTVFSIPLFVWLSFFICYSENVMNTIVFKILSFLPYIMGTWGVGRNGDIEIITFSLISSISTIIITVMISLLWFKKKDFK